MILLPDSIRILLIMRRRVAVVPLIHQELHHTPTTGERPTSTIITDSMFSKRGIQYHPKLFNVGVAPQRVKHLAGKVCAESKHGREAYSMVREEVEDVQR